MNKMLCLMICVMLGQAQAAGFFRNGDDLEDLGAVLGARAHPETKAFASGYVAGVADATVGVTWCPTPQVTEETIDRTVARFMQSHPESLRRSAATIVGEALTAEFPCEKK